MFFAKDEPHCAMPAYLRIGLKGFEVPLELSYFQRLISDQENQVLHVVFAEPSILRRICKIEDLCQVLFKFFGKLLIFGDEELKYGGN